MEYTHNRALPYDPMKLEVLLAVQYNLLADNYQASLTQQSISQQMIFSSFSWSLSGYSAISMSFSKHLRSTNLLTHNLTAFKSCVFAASSASSNEPFVRITAKADGRESDVTLPMISFSPGSAVLLIHWQLRFQTAPSLISNRERDIVGFGLLIICVEKLKKIYLTT